MTDMISGGSHDTPLNAAQPAEASVHCYSRRESGMHRVSLEEGLSTLASLRQAGSSDEAVLWIDILCPGGAEEALMRDRMNLHPLAVEDCMRGRQRPKLDRYNGYLFLVAYTAIVNTERDRTALMEVHIFVGAGWIISVHDRKVRIVSDVIARWRTNENAFPTTASLAHALLDGLVDSYAPVIDHLGTRVDDIEHLVLSEPSEEQMSVVLELRREIAIARRALWPMDEIMRLLLRRDAVIIDSALLPYYQDVLDHVRRETEELDSLRDTLAVTLDAYLSTSANQLNQTVRVMAAWSIILMAMAWIAGIYGMNFSRMPELNWRYGYAWAIGSMLTVGAGLVMLFRHRKWI